MADQFLYEKLDNLEEFEVIEKDIPAHVRDNLNPRFELRPYQEKAFARFFHCFERGFPGQDVPMHLLFNMATGSGKTLIMAGLILYLYQQDYRNFLFFVNSTNIIAKTKDNFLNPASSKYLFNQSICFGGNPVHVSSVENFEGVNPNDINICFTTVQQLHFDLNNSKENALTYDDFRNHRTVLLADEAHHLNVGTKSKQPSLDQSWEDSVERILREGKCNLLLEFTATLNYENTNIVEKYLNKVLFRYDLRQFRDDGFSKDVYIVQANLEERDRILQALILNQYKQQVAATHNIYLKPVILFKARSRISESERNKETFHKIIENLSTEDVLRIRETSNLPLLRKAFTFFDRNDLSVGRLVEILRKEFAESRCISINNNNQKEELQILINSLEDRNNRIRAIFAVKVLDEGWDVLNLFDIVRCNPAIGGTTSQTKRTTTSEAQLIGRGARYFPFVTDENSDAFRRKFDKDLNSDIRVLEELHYHSVEDSPYIAELRKALVNKGIMDDSGVEKTLKLKDSFKETSFYSKGIIYLNRRLRNSRAHVNTLSDLDVSSKNYEHKIATGEGTSNLAFQENGNHIIARGADRMIVEVACIPENIVKNALARNVFFSFDSLKSYFPHVGSTRQFMNDKQYLGGLAITFLGGSDRLKSMTNKDLLDGVSGLLSRIESELRKNRVEFKGTDRFSPKSVNSVFTDKTLKLQKGSSRSDGDEFFISDLDWYAYQSNYGTSEEKLFVRTLQGLIDSLAEKFSEIFLVRNERHFQIYNFEDGMPFEPDFVLFLREENGNTVTFQMFIEPKGKHLQAHDQWKEDFLKSIVEKSQTVPLEFSSPRGIQEYRLIGVPFYNNQNENEFKKTLFDVLGMN